MIVIGKIAGGIEGAHAKVEVGPLVGSIKANEIERFRADNDRVARRPSAIGDGWVRGNGKRGRKERMEAGCVTQSDGRGVLDLFGAWAGGRAHIVLMPEGERDLWSGSLNKDLVKPRLRRGRNCELVVRCVTCRANSARVDAKAAFSSSSLARVAVRVDHAHRQNVQRILICILAGLKNLKVALRKIANRIVILVSRHHVDHHLAGGHM